MLRHRSSENASLEWIGCSGEPDKARHLSMESMILPWCTECTVVTDSHSFYMFLYTGCVVKLLRFIWSPNCSPNISRHIPGFRFAAAHVHEVSQPGDVKVVEAPLHNRIFLYFSILSPNRWIWVLRTLQFGYAGISHRFQVGKTSIILTRDKNYKLHAFYNSCSSQLWSTVQNTHCRHLCSIEIKTSCRSLELDCLHFDLELGAQLWYAWSGAVTEVLGFAQAVPRDASSWLMPHCTLCCFAFPHFTIKCPIKCPSIAA